MTRTAKSHHLAETGTAAVLKFCNSNGWLGEHIRVDYGEDLVFQTNFKSQVDPFRIYAQCKATGGNPKKIRISRRHLLRWALMGELVVLFLYLQSTDEILFFEVNERFSFLDAWQSDQSTIAIPRSNFSILDRGNLRRLEWSSRMRGMSFLVSQHMSNRSFSEQFHEQGMPEEQTHRFNETEAGIFYLFLRYLGFMKIKAGTYSLNPTGHLKGVLQRIDGRLAGKRKGNPPLSIREYLALAVIVEWEKVSGGLGLNGMLAEISSYWLSVFVMSYFNEKGHSFKKLNMMKL
jgi:hypothetical protein